MKRYDTIIIGAGPAGLAAAQELVERQQVLVVDEGTWGGTCPNFGCDPKKMLYSAVQAKNWSGRMTNVGLVGIPQINWPRLMAFKRRYTEPIPERTRASLQQRGVATASGAVTFLDPYTIEVAGEPYRADHFVIATGRTPVKPEIIGADLLFTSTDFLDLDQLPHTVAFIGGGFVSLELATIAAAAGAQVHVIHHNRRLLRAFPEEATKRLLEAMQHMGVKFHFDATVTEATAVKSGVHLVGQAVDLTVGKAFVGVGRAPALPMGLPNAGVVTTQAGITVNDHLQTSMPHIYAAGDVVAKAQPKLTPVANFEGRYVGLQLLGDEAAISYPPTPEMVFGAVEVGQVGLSLAAAQAEPKRYTVLDQAVGQWYTYNRIQDASAQVITIVDRTNGQLAGAVVVGAQMEELLNLFTMAIAAKLPVDTIKHWLFTKPSAASDLPYLL